MSVLEMKMQPNVQLGTQNPHKSLIYKGLS